MLVVGLDGDDTLWHNERIFSMTEERFRSLVAPWVDDAPLDDLLLATERRNMAILGYGVKSFVLSMIETAIEVSAGRVPANVIAELIDAGKQMLTHPVELLDGVADTLPELAASWPLLLVTKGDLFHQESKLARSGLLPYLSHVEIVSEKDTETYRRVMRSAAVEVSNFVMVGDSVRSDIAPVLRLGGRAVHIPGFREWELERDVVDPEASGRWWTVDTIRDLPALLRSLE
ncbi:MAG: HAD family hydrolase [Acidimicrobiales bacterium]